MVKYKNAMKEASKYDSAEAKILESRILSIYTNFYLKDKIAEENFLKSYEIAKVLLKLILIMIMPMLKQLIH